MHRDLIQVHVQELLKNLGLPLSDPNFAETPRRVTDYLMEFNQGKSLEEALGTPFPNDAGIDVMLVQTGIPFRAVCAHHLLPFFGTASIGYIPKKHIVGLSKLKRLTEAAGTYKPSLQERITHDIVRVLDNVLVPTGVMVTIEAEHTCMAIRGVVAPGVMTITSAVRGAFRDVPQARQEFFELCRQQSRR